MKYLLLALSALWLLALIVHGQEPDINPPAVAVDPLDMGAVQLSAEQLPPVSITIAWYCAGGGVYSTVCESQDLVNWQVIDELPATGPLSAIIQDDNPMDFFRIGAKWGM